MSDKKKAQVFHFDLYGKREVKYDFLNNNSVKSISWNELDVKEPHYFFVKKDFSEEKSYAKGFKLGLFFNLNNSGFETAKDEFIIKNNFTECEELKREITNLSFEDISKKYSLKLEKSQQVKNDISNANSIMVLYRPFDYRYTLFSKSAKGVMFRPRYDTMKHFMNNNIGLLCCKRQTSFDFQHSFITNTIVERCSVSLQTGEVSYVFPLYLYSDSAWLMSTEQRKPNLNMEIVNQIADKLALRFTHEKDVSTSSTSTSSTSEGTLAPIDILDYIYAVLHSPTYREKYKEFLKIDFPRVPYPKDAKTFWQLVNFGGELRQIHLLESPIVENRITTYPKAGDNIVVKPRFENGKVRINDEQYFDNVPEIAWGFYIGGYQPAQKWLKDRKGRKLNFDDIVHYQKIIVALFETDNIMKKIDDIDFM